MKLFRIVPLLVALIPGARGAASLAFCPLGNGTMYGSYALSQTGTITGVGPFAVVGVATYDGQGGGSVTATRSVNGTIATFTAPATFTVNLDCTGSKTVGTGSNTIHFNFVISPDGKTITFIVTDTGTIAMGTAVRLDH